MIASFHTLAYRRRVFSPPRRLEGSVAGLRFWRALNIACEFSWYRAHAGRLQLWRTLRPNPRHWAFYALWEDEAALDAFLETSTVARTWADSCTEAWHLWLRPAGVSGPWDGLQLLRGSEVEAPRGEPLVCLAHLDLTLRGTLAMWASSAPGITHHLPDGERLLASLALVDRPYVQPMSFSVWSSLDAAMAFVHRDGQHATAVSRIEKVQADAVRRFSSGRFQPYRTRGTLNGRDPLPTLAAAA